MLALAQAPQSQFDDGAVLGRVCEDLDGDGACSSSEPGVPAVRVLLETGLESVADRDGRFHLAGVPARVAETYAGGRLVPGRHRLKIDTSSLAGEWEGAERGVTFEMPMGGAAYVEFPLRRAQAAPLTSNELPALRRVDSSLQYHFVFAAPPGEQLVIAGRPATDGSAWIPVKDGTNEIVISAARPGATRVWSQRLELVRRNGSTLVIPGELKELGVLTWPAAADSPACLDVKDQPKKKDDDGVCLVRGSEVHIARGSDNGITFNGLLDLQANLDVRTGAFSVFGRGAGAARARFAGFKLGAEVDFRDTDISNLPSNLLQARRVDVFNRQLDPMRTQTAWADDSATAASNPSEGRFRLELSREGWGSLGYGDARFFNAKADAGRVHRAVQGAFLNLKTPTDETPFGVELRGIAAPSQTDGTFIRREMHERFESTGGSLFFLAKNPVVQGSEVIRVEWRDAVTQLPVRDVHLQRLRDYTIDAVSGRILLARPLSFYVGDSMLGSDPLTNGLTAVLFVDYEYLDSGVSTDGVIAGELRGRLGPVNLSAGAFRQGTYGLYRGSAEAKLGPIWLSGEVAYSKGAVQGLAFSRDGGLTQQVAPSLGNTEGFGVTVRARGKGLFNKGGWDAAWRWRQAGFQDTAQVGALQQLSLRVDQPLGPVSVGLLGDYRDMPDPRSPFSGVRINAHSIGGGVGYDSPRWGIRLEAREFQRTPSDTLLRDGGITVGLSGRVRITEWLQLRAGYRQQVYAFGTSDSSFGLVGLDLKPDPKFEIGLRGGWGPKLGPQVWGTVSYSRANETWYGVQSIDADSPGTGDRRFAFGVRQQLAPDTAVFVEDVSAQEVDGLRFSRAVGMSQKLDDAFTVSARYEHGALALEGLPPDQARNTGGVSLSFDREMVRFFASGEVRDEKGAVPLRQFVASGGGEVRLHRDVSLTARALWTHSSKNNLLTGRSVDATAAIAWRFGRGALLARYAYKQNWTAAYEEKLHIISLLPTIRFGDRFAISAGANLGLTQYGPILSASIRPSVRLIAGLEIAGEAAARTLAPDGGSWASLRGEIGYRFDHRFFVGAGYTAFGFSGTGLETGATASKDRVYLRTEVSY